MKYESEKLENFKVHLLKFNESTKHNFHKKDTKEKPYIIKYDNNDYKITNKIKFAELRSKLSNDNLLMQGVKLSKLLKGKILRRKMKSEDRIPRKKSIRKKNLSYDSIRRTISLRKELCARYIINSINAIDNRIHQNIKIRQKHNIIHKKPKKSNSEEEIKVIYSRETRDKKSLFKSSNPCAQNYTYLSRLSYDIEPSKANDFKLRLANKVNKKRNYHGGLSNKPELTKKQKITTRHCLGKKHEKLPCSSNMSIMPLKRWKKTSSHPLFKKGIKSNNLSKKSMHKIKKYHKKPKKHRREIKKNSKNQFIKNNQKMTHNLKSAIGKNGKTFQPNIILYPVIINKHNSCKSQSYGHSFKVLSFPNCINNETECSRMNVPIYTIPKSCSCSLIKQQIRKFVLLNETKPRLRNKISRGCYVGDENICPNNVCSTIIKESRPRLFTKFSKGCCVSNEIICPNKVSSTSTILKLPIKRSKSIECKIKQCDKTCCFNSQTSHNNLCNKIMFALLLIAWAPCLLVFACYWAISYRLHPSYNDCVCNDRCRVCLKQRFFEDFCSCVKCFELVSLYSSFGNTCIMDKTNSPKKKEKNNKYRLYYSRKHGWRIERSIMSNCKERKPVHVKLIRNTPMCEGYEKENYNIKTKSSTQPLYMTMCSPKFSRNVLLRKSSQIKMPVTKHSSFNFPSLTKNAKNLCSNMFKPHYVPKDHNISSPIKSEANNVPRNFKVESSELKNEKGYQRRLNDIDYYPCEIRPYATNQSCPKVQIDECRPYATAQSCTKIHNDNCRPYPCPKRRIDECRPYACPKVHIDECGPLPCILRQKELIQECTKPCRFTKGGSSMKAQIRIYSKSDSEENKNNKCQFSAKSRNHDKGVDCLELEKIRKKNKRKKTFLCHDYDKRLCISTKRSIINEFKYLPSIKRFFHNCCGLIGIVARVILLAIGVCIWGPIIACCYCISRLFL